MPEDEILDAEIVEPKREDIVKMDEDVIEPEEDADLVAEDVVEGEKPEE